MSGVESIQHGVVPGVQIARPAGFDQLAPANTYSCFNTPETLTHYEIQAVRESGNLDMSWSFGEKGESHFRFVTEENEVYLELLLVGKALSMISEEIHSLLKVGRTEYGAEYQYFTYLLSQEDGEFSFVPLRSKMYSPPDSSSYLVHDRRVLREQPTEVDGLYLRDSLLSGRAAIYTGAGVSSAADVPTMGQLNELIGLEEGEEFLGSLEQVVKNPFETAKRVRLFHDVCFKNNDTAAHRAIAALSQTFGIPVITENLDCLHEVSGIRPYRINAEELRRESCQKEVCVIDWVICVGLSYDDKGFLGWYKDLHPGGKILAVDVNRPSYLGAEDYLLQADLQEVFSQMIATEMSQ